MEDFSPPFYVEVDPPADYLTVIPARVTFTNLRRGVVAYLYADKGVNHFGDFAHLFEMKVTACVMGSDVFMWGLGNAIGRLHDEANAICWAMNSNVAGIPRWYLYKIGVGTGALWNGILNTQYYVTMSRTGVNLTVTARTGSHAGPIVFNDTLNVGNTPFRYIYPVSSCIGGVEVASGYHENLDLQEPVPAAGTPIGGLMSAMRLINRVQRPLQPRFPRLRPLHV